MNLMCYLVVQGVETYRGSVRRKPGTIKVAKRKPSTAADEIAIRLEVEIPDGLFQKPTLEAKITVPNGIHGPIITTEVADNITDIIRRETGLTIRLSADDYDSKQKGSENDQIRE